MKEEFLKDLNGHVPGTVMWVQSPKLLAMNIDMDRKQIFVFKPKIMHFLKPHQNRPLLEFFPSSTSS